MPQSSRALISFRLAASRLSSRVVGIGQPLHQATICMCAVISKLSRPARFQRNYIRRRQLPLKLSDTVIQLNDFRIRFAQ